MVSVLNIRVLLDDVYGENVFSVKPKQEGNDIHELLRLSAFSKEVREKKGLCRIFSSHSQKAPEGGTLAMSFSRVIKQFQPSTLQSRSFSFCFCRRKNIDYCQKNFTEEMCFGDLDDDEYLCVVLPYPCVINVS